MKSGIVIIFIDELHLTIDGALRRVWAPKGSQPISYRNGSHNGINILGAYTNDRKFHYQELDIQRKEEILPALQRLHRKYKNVFFVLDKATWHKNKLVEKYFEDNKDTIEYVYFPTGAPDINPVEECWKQTRDKKTANTPFPSKNALRKEVKTFWRNQPFRHNPLNYLIP